MGDKVKTNVGYLSATFVFVTKHRYYQLLTGHALTAPFLKDKPKKTDSD